MLYLIGFGLSSAQDLTLRAISVLKSCDVIFLDSYTSCAIDPYALNDLRELIGKNFIEADRKLVEQGTEILHAAQKGTVAFLVIGDPLSATTHIDMVQRAIIENIPFETINNTSIMTAVGVSGLCLYEFGRTISIPLWDEFGETSSFYEKVEMNLKIGTHTLCLLDIKVKEQSLQNLLKGNDIYEPPRFMTCEVAANQFMRIIGRIEDSGKKALVTPAHLVMGLSRIGSSEQAIAVGTLNTFFRMLLDGTSMLSNFLGRPLHSLIIMGRLQTNELEHLMLSVSSLRSEKTQPVLFLDPNRKATPNDKKVVEKILHDHNLKCLRIIEEAKAECPEYQPAQQNNGDSEECITSNTKYIPKLL